KDKVKYDKIYNEILNRRRQGRIKNYDVLSREKVPITLKVYRDDGSDEIIQNFKANDLQLREWREVMHVVLTELELDGPPSTLIYRLEWKTYTKLKRS
nr:hypothetical protein [Tanacetum cinerariifolium]